MVPRGIGEVLPSGRTGIHVVSASTRRAPMRKRSGKIMMGRFAKEPDVHSAISRVRDVLDDERVEEVVSYVAGGKGVGSDADVDSESQRQEKGSCVER